MTEVKKTISVFVIFVLVLIAVFFLPPKTEEPITDEFQLGLMGFGVEEDDAFAIAEYFRGEREYLTWDEMTEITEVYNQIVQKEEFFILEGIDSIPKFIKELNKIIINK